MSDLIERLRECAPPHIEDEEMCHKAADEIERLKAMHLECTKRTHKALLRVEVLEGVKDAAEIAYSEMAFAVHDIAGRRLTSDEAMDRRSDKLSKVADELRVALDAATESGESE